MTLLTSAALATIGVVAALSSGDAAVAIVPVLLSGGVIGVLVGHRAANRKNNADARLADATADHTLQNTYQEWIEDQRLVSDDLRKRLDEMSAQMSDLRDRARGAESAAAEAKVEAARARTDRAEAEQRVAELEAELARALKDSGDERHKMQSDIRMLTDKLGLKEIQITDLRTEVDTLSARMGVTERRQSAGS